MLWSVKSQSNSEKQLLLTEDIDKGVHMKMVRKAILFMSLLCFVTSVEAQKNRVLMVGNSLTYFNRGLGYVLERMAKSSNPPIEIDTTLFTVPMFSLGDLWKRVGSRQEQIISGRYDLVLLQDYLFKPGGVRGEDESEFRESVNKFYQLVGKGKARCILFMPWHFNEAGALPIEDIARIHAEVARDLGIQVAPIGLAWAKSEKENPDLDLYYDSEHPSPYGSYLAGCVLYATLFGKSPDGLPYQGEDLMIGAGTKPMPQEAVQRLQKLAWQVVADYPLSMQP
jgi:hypothetical protein